MIHVGDCRDILPMLPAESVDSIVTDPPYELGFMGKSWDSTGVAFDPRMWSATLRVAKPGAYMLAFGGTRTFHRIACAIEDAGWELRDTIMWVYGSGFPKSRNGEWGGTALKPAWEPIILARKPLAGTVAENYAAHGTGGLNIDRCRIETAENLNGGAYSGGGPGRSVSQSLSPSGMNRQGARAGGEFEQPCGRWPANLIHDGSEEVLSVFPRAPGQQAAISGTAPSAKTSNVFGRMRREGEPSSDSENAGAVGFKMRPGDRRLDVGSAARFFYCAKASRADREQGCDDLPLRTGGMVSNTSGQHITRRDGGAPGQVRNNHPTVKPTELMRYLCRLVTPPGGVVLDPFAGSGSTGRGAVAEGMQFVGVELDQDHAEIARRRIAAVQPGLALRQNQESTFCAHFGAHT